MKKETMVAVLFGTIFGAIFATVLLVENKELQLKKAKTIAPTITVGQSANNLNKGFQVLEITEPQDSTIVNSNTITIKGKAEKNSLIIIQSPNKESVFKIEKEQFAVDFPLAFGENIIKIAVYPADSQARFGNKELKIYYLDEQ